MKSKTTKTAIAPQCRKCGSTDIQTTYTENHHGHEIDETTILEMALYFIGSALKDTEESAEHLTELGHTYFGLATMLRVRKVDDADTAEEATPEAQS